jgi:hypothetical protein
VVFYTVPSIRPTVYLFLPLFCSRNSTLRLTVEHVISSCPHSLHWNPSPSAYPPGGVAEHTNRIVLDHTQRAVGTRPHKRLVVSRHRHRDQSHSNGTRFCCARTCQLFPHFSVFSPASPRGIEVPFLAMAPFRRVVGKESCGFYVGVSCRDIFGTRRWRRRDMVRQSYPECMRRVILRDATGTWGFSLVRVFFGGDFWVLLRNL